MCCPAPLALWKLIRRSRTRFRDRPKTVRLHPGIGVHLHPGSLFGIIPDWRSASSRNRVHVPPESPQERQIERVGGNNSIPVDVRVLAATHRDLNALVADGRFREDLLYRLNVVPIEVPPLRDRVADIPLLVEYFINRFGKRAGKKFQTIDKKSLKAFQSYAWPGNVRELQNVIERAVILSEGETFAMDEGWLRTELRANPRRTGTLHGTLVKQEKEMIEAALVASQGRISGPSGAAIQLGLPSRTLDSKIKRLKINKYRFKLPPEA